MVAFQSNGIFIFIPTGNADMPYRRVVLSTKIGAVSNNSIVMGEDGSGLPALYFLDPINGPYRLLEGYTLQWLGKDVKDLLDSTYWVAPSAFGVYDSVRKLVIWKIGSGTASKQIVFDVTNSVVVGPNEVRKGWCHWSALQDFVAGVMFSNLLTGRDIKEVTYFGGRSGANSLVLHRNSPTATTDSGTPFQGYARTRAFRWNPLGRLKKLLEAILIAKSRAATTLRTRYISNWGEATLDQTVSIAPVGSSTYVRPRPNPVDFTDLDTLQIQVGDAAAVDNTWELEAFEAQLEEMDENR